MSQPKSAPKKSGGGKSILTVIIVLVVIAALAGAGWYVFLRSTPEKTVKQFLQAAEKGDSEAITKLLTERSKGQGFEEYGKDMIPVEKQEGEKEPPYTIGKAEITGNTAIVPVTTKIEDKMAAAIFGGELKVSLALMKEAGRWKIAWPKFAPVPTASRSTKSR